MQDKKPAEKIAVVALAYFLAWGVARTANSKKFVFHWKGAALGFALAAVTTLLNLRKVWLDFKFKDLKGTESVDDELTCYLKDNPNKADDFLKGYLYNSRALEENAPQAFKILLAEYQVKNNKFLENQPIYKELLDCIENKENKLELVGQIYSSYIETETQKNTFRFSSIEDIETRSRFAGLLVEYQKNQNPKCSFKCTQANVGYNIEMESTLQLVLSPDIIDAPIDLSHICFEQLEPDLDLGKNLSLIEKKQY